jgi:hypothetical protein
LALSTLASSVALSCSSSISSNLSSAKSLRECFWMVIAAARCCISHHRQCIGQYLISACCPAHTGSVLGLVSDWAVMTYLSMIQNQNLILIQFGFESLNLRRLPQKDIASR